MSYILSKPSSFLRSINPEITFKTSQTFHQTSGMLEMRTHSLPQLEAYPWIALSHAVPSTLKFDHKYKYKPKPFFIQANGKRETSKDYKFVVKSLNLHRADPSLRRVWFMVTILIINESINFYVYSSMT